MERRFFLATLGNRWVRPPASAENHFLDNAACILRQKVLGGEGIECSLSYDVHY